MLPVGLALAALSMLLFWSIRRLLRERASQEELVRRVRSSRVYQAIYPTLMKCREYTIDEIHVRSDSLVIRLLQGETLIYRFEEHGMDDLQPRPLLAVAQAIALDLPQLQNAAYYVYEPRTEILPGGDKLKYYAYTLKNDRKDYLLRHHRLDTRDR